MHPTDPLQDSYKTFDPKHGRHIWQDLLGAGREVGPSARLYAYTAEHAIPDPALRERVLMAMKEVLSRCVQTGGKLSYRAVRRDDLPNDYLARVRRWLPGLDGEISLASRRELVPSHPSFSEQQRDILFQEYVAIANARRFPLIPHVPRSALFAARPLPYLAQFPPPARDVLGDLSREPMLSELAEFLAIAGDAASQGDPDAAARAAGYLIDAAKTPPIVVRHKDRTDLILVCAD